MVRVLALRVITGVHQLSHVYPEYTPKLMDRTPVDKEIFRFPETESGSL
jgi:hypothetical protein